jgi:hypothetical protein
MEEVTTTAQATTSTQESKSTEATTSTTESTAKQSETKQPDIETLIQKAVDRATNKLGNENKRLRAELDQVKKDHMSEEERREAELQEREAAFAERERELADKENRLIAIKAIKEVGLDDGSELSLALVDFVMAEDEDTIKERVKTFDSLVKRMVQAEVDKVFKNSGRVPGKGSASTSETDSKKDSVAVRIGQNAAKANKAAQTTLEYYTGGKKR